MWQTIFQPQTGQLMWTHVFNQLSLRKFSYDHIKYVYIDTCGNMYSHAHEGDILPWTTYFFNILDLQRNFVQILISPNTFQYLYVLSNNPTF